MAVLWLASAVSGAGAMLAISAPPRQTSEAAAQRLGKLRSQWSLMWDVLSSIKSEDRAGTNRPVKVPARPVNAAESGEIFFRRS